MKKYFYVALVALVSAVLLVSCEPANKDDLKGEGEWITSSAQIDLTLLDNEHPQCWYIDMWCDGTTIGREYQWATEAEIGAAVKLMLEMDLKVNGKQTKKIMYCKSDAQDKESCESQVWEGAVCWEETISYNGEQSQTNYGWMPETNMKERHDYYESKGLTHTYKRADAEDYDSCDKLNPGKDDDPEKPQDPDEPKDYSKYDSIHYKCWEITQAELGMTATTYLWQTEQYIVMLYDMIGVDYTYKAVKDIEDEYACMELEDSQNIPKACWKITEVIMGVNQVVYVWDTEAGVKATVDAINESGYGTATYELTSIEDEDSCMAQND